MRAKVLNGRPCLLYRGRDYFGYDTIIEHMSTIDQFEVLKADIENVLKELNQETTHYAWDRGAKYGGKFKTQRTLCGRRVAKGKINNSTPSCRRCRAFVVGDFKLR
jgi:nitrate/TMAO reductase-like tetraheme cytochrome c subunit